MKWLRPLIDPILSLFFIKPPQGALAQLYAATSPEIESKGRGKHVIPFGKVTDKVNPLALDDALVDKLWDFTDALIKEKLAV
jgi:hypothetical protein